VTFSHPSAPRSRSRDSSSTPLSMGLLNTGAEMDEEMIHHQMWMMKTLRCLEGGLLRAHREKAYQVVVSQAVSPVAAVVHSVLVALPGPVVSVFFDVVLPVLAVLVAGIVVRIVDRASPIVLDFVARVSRVAFCSVARCWSHGT